MFGRVCRVALLSSLLFASGCVERALVITSEPSGAEVTVNQQWRGTTPFVVPFKHYGVYDIWIEHPGIEENGRMVKYYPLHVGEPVKAPGYQYPGADFVTEVLLPTTLRDQHNLHYRLERVSEADDLGDVLARAQQLRDAGAARRLMRYEKDVSRGRYDQVGNAAPLPPGETEPVDYYGEPPLPSEVPVFIDNY